MAEDNAFSHTTYRKPREASHHAQSEAALQRGRLPPPGSASRVNYLQNGPVPLCCSLHNRLAEPGPGRREALLSPSPWRQKWSHPATNGAGAKILRLWSSCWAASDLFSIQPGCRSCLLFTSFRDAIRPIGEQADFNVGIRGRSCHATIGGGIILSVSSLPDNRRKPEAIELWCDQGATIVRSGPHVVIRWWTVRGTYWVGTWQV